MLSRSCDLEVLPARTPWLELGGASTLDRIKERELSTKGPPRRQGSPHRGRGAAPGIFGFGGNLCKTSPWEGAGENWYTRRVPGYHTNHSPRKKSWETSWGTNTSTKSCFSGPLFGPHKGPRAFLDQDVWSGLPKGVPGSKISKLRIEKTCRIHRAMLQTEPHVASYGQIRFGGGAP